MPTSHNERQQQKLTEIIEVLDHVRALCHAADTDETLEAAGVTERLRIVSREASTAQAKARGGLEWLARGEPLS